MAELTWMCCAGQVVLRSMPAWHEAGRGAEALSGEGRGGEGVRQACTDRAKAAVMAGVPPERGTGARVDGDMKQTKTWRGRVKAWRGVNNR